MFVLKSRSPRRIELLNSLGIRFITDPADILEDEIINESPLAYLERIVIEKLDRLSMAKPTDLLLTCDTIVVFENKLLHKPSSFEDSIRILRTLNNKTHIVFSGACLYQRGEMDFFYEETKIKFKNWNEIDVIEYIHTHNPFDKAGSYGIQDQSGPVLSKEGSYHNVMGFPLRSFLSRWEKWIPYWNECL